MRLLDTTVAIDHLRGDERARSALRLISSRGEPLYASELIRFELYGGARDEELPAIDDFCRLPIWRAVDEPISRLAGELARRYRAAFSGIDDVDYLIAATALVLEAELLTTNVRHFPMLQGLEPAY